ncbi:MAG: bifunctional pyr operon transcriptional regulator/uracil phosphoribosyltransferase PyrR [Lentisphaeria bacterium]|nr:bifunctional pyr operon transcriptional regulator/uracil phosphoribosyltransferase PyrR [Lentisphaeria bacterium]
MENAERKKLLSGDAMAEYVEQLVSQILNEFRKEELEEICLIGLQSSGVPLTRRIVRAIREKTGVEPAAGTLDISMYRDDIGTRKSLPLIRETEIPFDINGKTIILTDGVIQTGRSIRAALDALTDFGRPGKIRLAVLVDRGMREFPISPDYAGVKLDVEKEYRINVQWHEFNDEDAVYQVPRRK